jgi:hypothetical protein
MNHIPLDERVLLESLPWFRELGDDEKDRIHLIRFEYQDLPVLFSCDLLFEYWTPNDRKILLKFEMMGSREDDHFFRHVIYEDGDFELEFPDFRRAIDYFEVPRALLR